MAARGLVFIGPSLPDPPARSEIAYAPPARRGDVLEAARRGVDVIGLIDGVLVGELAVSPGEVRDAARTGARLIGGASLGALRAVERPNDVEGVGEVFEAFRDGVLTDDDEVTATFDAEMRYVALPLVTIRDRLSQMIAARAIDPRHGDAIIAALRALPFDQRTERALLHAARAQLGDEVASALVARMRTLEDVKRRDARRVIDAVARALTT
ncbi:TfuA-like protein [Sandaracinus amylolyticus]|uniref:TfuA-like protein n=1 Tax=Sandaracinus amylolyticus TaxID=927083 RepID=UPI001EEB5CB1|nr:TfuA-like protein [Sandaracinus amylolyticus]UJR83392.1 Hypothetical protein I5071_54600 [Sandaracinus amylolyticus]